MRDRPGPGSAGNDGSGRRAERCLAMVATVLVHGVFVGVIRLDAAGGHDAGAAREDDALQVVWIERPAPPATPVPAPAARARRDPAARVSPPSPDHRPDAPAGARNDAITTAVPEAAGDAGVSATLGIAGDAWGPNAPASRDIDPAAFRRDPLARRDTTFDPPPARLEASIRDRSFGGWMQRATRRRICGELAAQLRRAPESTGAILESMRRHDCKG